MCIVECTHTGTSATALLPGMEPRCELGPQRVIIRLSINQSTNSSKARFILIFPPFSAFTVQDSCIGLYDDLILLILSVIPDVFTERTTVHVKVYLSSTRHQSSSVQLKWSPLTDSEATVSCLNTLRQFQGNNRLCQLESRQPSLSLPKNAKGLIRVLSIFLGPS